MEDCHLYVSKSEAAGKAFHDAAIQCIGSVWRDVKTSNGLLLSLLGYICGFDPKPFYADMWYNPVEVIVEEDVVDKLKLEHRSKPYENGNIKLANYALLLLLLGKRVEESSYKAWAKARAKAILRMYYFEFKPEDFEQVVNFQWATNANSIYRRSRGFRVKVLEFMLMARARSEFGHLSRILDYICLKFLPYARIKGIWLVQNYLIPQWKRPILGDPYLSTDLEHWAAAMRAWAEFPPNERIYAGIIATDDVFHLLSGSQLQRLTYIAARAGARDRLSWRTYKCKAPPDKKECDALVEKYFSSDAKLPEDIITPRLSKFYSCCFENDQMLMGPLPRHVILAIAECESVLTEEQHEVREWLTKQRIVATLMFENEALRTPFCPGVPSTITYRTQGNQTEEYRNPLQKMAKMIREIEQCLSPRPFERIADLNETEVASYAIQEPAVNTSVDQQT